MFWRFLSFLERQQKLSEKERGRKSVLWVRKCQYWNRNFLSYPHNREFKKQTGWVHGLTPQLSNQESWARSWNSLCLKHGKDGTHLTAPPWKAYRVNPGWVFRTRPEPSCSKCLCAIIISSWVAGHCLPWQFHSGFFFCRKWGCGSGIKTIQSNKVSNHSVWKEGKYPR